MNTGWAVGLHLQRLRALQPSLTFIEGERRGIERSNPLMDQAIQEPRASLGSERPEPSGGFQENEPRCDELGEGRSHPDRAADIADLIAEGRTTYGSQSFDQHLLDLVREGTVDFKVAKAAATNPSDLDLKVNFLGEGGEKKQQGEDMSHLFGGG